MYNKFKNTKSLKEMLRAMKSMGDRIKALRKSKGLTQTEFGNIFGIVKSTVSLYENNRSTPDDEMKIRICDYFHVSMDYLMGTPVQFVLGTELRKMIKEISEEIDVDYDLLVDIFINQDKSHRLSKDNLLRYFSYVLSSDRGIDRTPLEIYAKDLTKDETEKVIEYIKFIKSQR